MLPRTSKYIHRIDREKSTQAQNAKKGPSLAFGLVNLVMYGGGGKGRRKEGEIGGYRAILCHVLRKLYLRVCHHQ
jgi:hypothetical protein